MFSSLGSFVQRHALFPILHYSIRGDSIFSDPQFHYSGKRASTIVPTKITISA
jgi:hypothetical protein